MIDKPFTSKHCNPIDKLNTIIKTTIRKSFVRYPIKLIQEYTPGLSVGMLNSIFFKEKKPATAFLL